MIADFAKEEFIRIGAPAADWKEALRAGGQLLLDNGCIEPRYIDNMIRIVEEEGAYIVIAPGLALGHARPEDGAIKVGFSFTTLEKPVEFGNPDNDPVVFLICLSAVDSTMHIEAIGELAEMLMADEEIIDRMAACGTASELADILKGAESQA